MSVTVSVRVHRWPVLTTDEKGRVVTRTEWPTKTMDLQATVTSHSVSIHFPLAGDYEFELEDGLPKGSGKAEKKMRMHYCLAPADVIRLRDVQLTEIQKAAREKKASA